MKKYLVVISGCLLLTNTATAQDPTEDSLSLFNDTFAAPDLTDDELFIPEENINPGSFMIGIDQDFFFNFPKSYNEDRNYTQGTAFTYSHPRLGSSFAYWPIRLIAKADKKLGKAVMSSISLGGTAFTPRAIDDTLPVIGDRPFAFLLYLSTSSTFHKAKTISSWGNRIRTAHIYHTITINYGMFGTNLGFEFQSYAHQHLILGRPIPYGWRNQVSKGGSPTLLVAYNRFRPLPVLNIHANAHHDIFDMGWNFGGSVGYYDRLHTGLFARLGYLIPDNIQRWNGGWNALDGANKQEADFSNREKSSFWEYFVYGRINTTLMFRNSMLVGQRFVSSVYTLQSDWVKTALLEYEWGITVNYQRKRKNEDSFRSYSLTYRLVYRSPEFDSHIFPARWHYFGGVMLSVPVH